MNNPIIISDSEWQEIVENEDIRATWALDDELSEYNAMTAHEFKEEVYGCKFNYVNEGPGYDGDVFCLYGDPLDNAITLIRDVNNKLKLLI